MDECFLEYDPLANINDPSQCLVPCTITLPANQSETIECATDLFTPVPPSVTDFCGTDIIPTGPTIDPSPTCEGDVVYEWIYEECSGNQLTWTYTFTIDYTMAPVLSEMPMDITVECASDVPGDPGVTAMDNCGETLTVMYSQSALGMCPGDDEVTNTWTVTDCAGNTTTHVQTITIEDTMAPVLSEMPMDITVECASDVPGDPGVTAMDNCGETLTVCLLYTSPSPRDQRGSRMPSSA